MVEMTESANILHNATRESLVLMDEVGRGTSTFDGLALAWAIARQLAEKNQSYTLFATHYFELTRLADEYREVANVHLDAVEHKDRIVFLHAVEEGPASQSYGIQVAQLAGIPAAVVKAARKHLAFLESQAAAAQPQGDLFSAPAPATHPRSRSRRSIRPWNSCATSSRTTSARARRWSCCTPLRAWSSDGLDPEPLKLEPQRRRGRRGTRRTGMPRWAAGPRN